MKKLIGLFTGAVLGGLVSQAQAAEKPDITSFNSNAVVETFLRKVDAHAGRTARPKPYKRLTDYSIACAGEIPADITVMDKGRPVLMTPMVPELVRFANDTKATDKDSQQKIKDTLTRKDLGYLEYTSISGPTTKEIESYVQNDLKAAPIDLYQAGAKMPDGSNIRDGSMRTTLLIDQKALEKFVTDNAKDIRATESAMAAAERRPSYTFSACGLKAP